MKQIYIILLTLLLSVCMTACQNDSLDIGGADGPALVLAAGSGGDYKQTRTEDNPQFQAGTLFHLYGTTTDAGNNETWAVNYLNSGKGTTIAKANSSEYKTTYNAWTLASTEEQKNGGFGLADKFLTKPLNLYGVAAVGVMADETPDTNEQIAAHNTTLDGYARSTNSTGIPQYGIIYPAAASGANSPALPDIMWSGSMKNLMPIDHAGNIVMPYVHTLSKLNFHAVLAPGLDATYTNMKITGLTITDYADGTLSMADGLYTREDAATRSVTADVAYLKSDVTLTETAQHFATTLAFPTKGTVYATRDGETEAEPINVELSVAYGTNFETLKTFTVPLTDDKNLYQVFKPNHEYDITFSITTSGVIVTLVPTFYEVGETIDLFDFEMGEPIDFGGVLWAAQNLGATSSDPTESAIAWEKARGFYYQLGRSIPYFVRGSQEDPFPDVSIYKYIYPDNEVYTHDIKNGDEGTIEYNSNEPASYWDGEQGQVLYTQKGLDEYNLTENVRVPYGRVNMQKARIHGARAYPYIPALWEALKKRGSTTYKTDYLAGTRAYLPSLYNGQENPTEPTYNISDPYYAKEYVNADLSTIKSNLNRFAMSSYNSRKRWHRTRTDASNGWVGNNGNMNSPAPKGWRLPTEDDFLSIMPVNQLVGDIAFTKKLQDNSNTLSKTNRQYRYFSKEQGFADYKGDDAVYVGIYQDGSGYNDLGTTNMDGTNYKEGWGSIFCVKRYRTDDAYLLRWQIEIADYDEVKAGLVVPSRYDVDPETQPYIGRGVLVISKYDLGNDHNNQLCIVAEEVSGVNVGDKDALHQCRVFVDSDNDKTKDAGEETIDVDWSRPSGQLKLPISGYEYVYNGGQALFYPGSEGIYWISTKGTDGNEGQTVRIKFSGDYASRFIEMYKIEVPVNGCQIRCVRDTGADYE